VGRRSSLVKRPNFAITKYGHLIVRPCVKNMASSSWEVVAATLCEGE
jgi:hypothetical protein